MWRLRHRSCQPSTVGLLLIALLLLAAAPALGLPQENTDVAAQANRLIQEGRFAEAIGVLEAGIKEHPDQTALTVLLTLAEVQREEERERLIERGLRFFVEQPGVACEAWARLVVLDPDDAEAKRQLSLLRETLAPERRDLERAATDHLERGAFHDALAAANQLRTVDCGDGTSEALRHTVEEAYKADLEVRLRDYDRLRASGECATVVPAVAALVGDRWLSAAQTARAYLTLGACQHAEGALAAAAESIGLALDFDEEIAVPDDLAPAIVEMVEAARTPRGSTP